MRQPLFLLERVAGYVAIGYLVLAVTPRILSGFGIFVPLAAFYWSLPGALAGSAMYAAWTGLRARRQTLLGMVVAGMAGVLAVGFGLLEMPPTFRPFSISVMDSFAFFSTALYTTLCDLSGIVFLFALFLVAFVPASGRMSAERPDLAASRKS